MSDGEFLFYAKTSEGWVMKIISDHLKTCVKTNGRFCISEHGIALRQESEDGHVFHEMELRRDDGGFDRGYEFNHNCNLYKGMKLSELQRAVKNVKKKDAIEMYIKKSDPTSMYFIVHSVEQRETNRVNIFDTERVTDAADTKAYDHPMIIQSVSFQKMIKKVQSMTDHKVRIRIQGSHYASFFADADSLSDSLTEYGTLREGVPYYEESLYISDLKKIVKMTSMSKIVKVYAPLVAKYPAKFSTKAGNLGDVHVYIKDAAFIEAENVMSESEEA